MQASAQVRSFLGEAAHSMGACRDERVYKGGEVPLRWRIRPVKLVYSASEALSKVGEKSLVEVSSLVMTNCMRQACFGLSRLRVTCHDDKCGIRHAFHL